MNNNQSTVKDFKILMKQTYFLNIHFMMNFLRKQSVVTMYPDYYTVKQVIKIFDNVKRPSLENSTSKTAFLAVWKVIVRQRFESN